MINDSPKNNLLIIPRNIQNRTIHIPIQHIIKTKFIRMILTKIIYNKIMAYDIMCIII
jgi:hypothetical protein